MTSVDTNTPILEPTLESTFEPTLEYKNYIREITYQYLRIDVSDPKIPIDTIESIGLVVELIVGSTTLAPIARKKNCSETWKKFYDKIHEAKDIFSKINFNFEFLINFTKESVQKRKQYRNNANENFLTEADVLWILDMVISV